MRSLARKKMIGKLKEEMKSDDSNDLGEKLKGKLQKVTVMAKDKKGLEKGLSMAQQIINKKKGIVAADGGMKMEEPKESKEDPAPGYFERMRNRKRLKKEK